MKTLKVEAVYLMAYETFEDVPVTLALRNRGARGPAGHGGQFADDIASEPPSQ